MGRGRDGVKNFVGFGLVRWMVWGFGLDDGLVWGLSISIYDD